MNIPQHLQPTGRLITYRPEQQHFGTYLSGFPWRLYCTGTFRVRPSDDSEAIVWLKRFVAGLGKAMQFRKRDISAYSVLEDKYSGLGKPVRKHWHFLLACPANKLLLTVARQLWIPLGWPKITAYDDSRPGAYYMSKLVSEGAVTDSHQMQYLQYSGPTDLIAATASSEYVEDRLKSKTHGEFLVHRPLVG